MNEEQIKRVGGFALFLLVVLIALSIFGNQWAHAMAVQLFTTYFLAAAYTGLLAIPYMLFWWAMNWLKKRYPNLW